MKLVAECLKRSKGGRGYPALEARDRFRIDADLFCELVLGETNCLSACGDILAQQRR